jgi:divalent metal cation (Fe/Co/Zn/Cd) transporter
LRIVWPSTREIGLRVLDGIEPDVIDRVHQEAAAVPGVLDVQDVRARWFGHTIRPEVTLTLAGDETVAAADRIVHAVGHRLTDHIDFVADPAIRTSAQRT